MKWEYKAISMGGIYIDALNELGQEGWELVAAAISDQTQSRGVFERFILLPSRTYARVKETPIPSFHSLPLSLLRAFRFLVI